MSLENVSFLETMAELQKNQRRREEESVELERQFYSNLTSDKRVRKIKAIELQQQWKRICEQEKKSRWRNEQIIKDLDRLETDLAAVSAKTERLKAKKKQYEDHIEMMYPNWKEKVMAMIEHNKQVEEEKVLHSQIAATLPRQRRDTADLSRPYAGYAGPSLYDTSRSAYSAAQHTHTTAYSERYTHTAQATVGQQAMYSAQDVVRRSHLPPPSASGYQDTHRQSLSAVQPPPPPEFSNDAVESEPQPSQPSGSGVYSSSQAQQHRTSITSSSPHRIPTGAAATPAHTTGTVHAHTTGTVHAHTTGAAAMRTPSGSGHGPVGVTDSRTDDEMTMSEFGDLDPVTPRSARSHSVAGGGGRSEHLEALPAPDLTFDGLYHLFTNIEDHIRETADTSQLYRAQTPAPTVKTEIINNANRGAAMVMNSVEAMTVVVLEQLPLLVYTCAGECLFTDQMVLMQNVHHYQDTVAHIDRTARQFWELLHKHFVHLGKHHVMSADQIADMFAAHLLTPGSQFENQARSLVVRLLENTPQDGSSSPASTATLSMHNTPQHQPLYHPATATSPPPVTVPQATLNATGSSQYSEDASAAYQKMMGPAASSGDYEDSSDSDDIENQLTRDMHTPSLPVTRELAPPQSSLDAEHSASHSVSEGADVSRGSLDLSDDQSKRRPKQQNITPVVSPRSKTMSPTELTASRKPDFMYHDSSEEEADDNYNKMMGSGSQVKSQSSEGFDDDDFYQ